MEVVGHSDPDDIFPRFASRIHRSPKSGELRMTMVRGSFDCARPDGLAPLRMLYPLSHSAPCGVLREARRFSTSEPPAGARESP